MNVESVAIEQLQFDPNNARKHSQKNLDAIKGSLTKFGQQKPIVVDKNMFVVAGNGTLAAAKELGWSTIIVVNTGLDSLLAKAYALADNRTSELAEWDDERLKTSNDDDAKSEDEYFDFLQKTLNVATKFSETQMLNLGLLESAKRPILRLVNEYAESFKDIIYWNKRSSTPHIVAGIVTMIVEPILPEIILTNFCKNSVLDLFMGTGTTMIAAEKVGRKCYGMEIDPLYCQVIIDRWEKYSGKKAEKV